MMQFEYEIDGRKFTQRKLVLGQVRQIMELLPEIRLSGDLTPLSLVIDFGDMLPKGLAVVLREEGRDFKEKDPEALAAWLDEHCDADTALQVVQDFFDCNPLSSLFGRLAKMADMARTAMKAREGGSMGSSFFSPAATSPGGTSSSGDTPPRSASSGQPTGAVN